MIRPAIEKPSGPLATDSTRARPAVPTAAWILRAITHGDWALMALTGLVYLHPPPALKPLNARWVGAFLLLTILWRWGIERERPRSVSSVVLLVWGYVMVGVISVAVAVDFDRAGEALVRLAKDATLCTIIVLLVRRRLTLERVIWALLCAGGVMGTLGAYQWATGTFDRDYWGLARSELDHIVGNIDAYRLLGPGGDANVYAQVLLPLVALAFGQIWNARRWYLRCAAVWVFEVCMFAVVLTHSRGGFIGALALLALLAVACPPRWTSAAVLGLLLIPVIWFAPPSYHLRIGTLVDLAAGHVSSLTRTPTTVEEMRREPGLRGRVSENVSGWIMFKEHPVLGVGVGNYQARYQEYARRLRGERHHEDRQAHNLYLEVAAETGLVGVAVFGAILFVAFRRAERERRRLLAAQRLDDARLVASVAIAFAGYLTTSLFLHAANTGHFGLLLGLVFVLPGVTDEGPVLGSSVAGRGSAEALAASQDTTQEL